MLFSCAQTGRIVILFVASAFKNKYILKKLLKIKSECGLYNTPIKSTAAYNPILNLITLTKER